MLTAMTKQEILFICFSFIGISNAAVSAPTDFTWSKIRSTSITTTWTMGGDLKYEIAVVASYGGIANEKTPTGINKVTSPYKFTKINSMDDLMPNTHYNIRLFAINPANGSDFATADDIAQLPTAAPAPTNVEISNVSSTQFDIKWNYTNPTCTTKCPLQIATKYIITYKPDGGINKTKNISNIATTSISITGLTSNTNYTVSVVAWKNNSVFTDDSAPSTQATTFDKPTAVTIKSSTSSTIDVNWNAPEDGGGAATIAGYIVYWSPAHNGGSMEVTREASITAKITGLTSNTDYDVTVAALSSLGGFGAISDYMTGTTVPRKLNMPTCMDQTTTSISLQWDPANGTLSVTYNVTWNPPSGNGTNNKPDITNTSTTIEDLTPGTRYDFTVSAVNNGGSGLPSEPSSLYTDPDTVKNLTLSQNPTNPATVLDLTWITPQGLGNSILVKYDSLTSSSLTANKEVNFSTTSTSVIVIPGNNYTVNVTVISNGLASMTVMEQLNSKPSEPVYTVAPSTNKLQLMWNEPDGYIEGFVIQFDNKSIQLDANSRFHTISNLTLYTSYTIQMYSWITNINGNIGKSISTPSMFTTWANPPPLSNPQASLNQDVTSATTTISFILPADTYNDANAPIEYYAVYITSGDATGTTPDVTRNETCVSSENGTINECVALWTDGQGNPTTFNKTMNEIGSSRSNQRITFVIGNGISAMSPWNQVFTNYPLQPGTSYRISVAAKTNNPQMTGMDWSSPIQTLGAATTGTDAGLIAGLVCAAVVIVLALVGFYFYRKRYIQKDPPQEDHFNHHNSVNTTINQPPMDEENKPTRREDSRLIKISDFNNYMQRMKERGNQGLVEEFEEMKDVGREQSTNIALTPENYHKNRYKKSILPYDKTRVVLSTTEEDPISDFINANFIPGYKRQREFIATQGPLGKTIVDFWRMIWEQNSRYIVMLTQIVEGEKIKCHRYWPHDNKPVQMNDLTLEYTINAISKDWTLREFKLMQGSETRCIKQFHYTSWPDHGVPETSEALVKFITHFREAVDSDVRTGPTVVHCSAGVGRTGTFIAMDHLLQHMKEHSDVDIFGIVYEMRKHRMSMVQSDMQYVLLHTMLQETINQVYDNYTESPVYENAQPPAPIYENTTIGKELHGSFNQSFH